MMFDLAGAQDVREAIEWAEAKLAAGEGPLSDDGIAVQLRRSLRLLRRRMNFWDASRADGPLDNADAKTTALGAENYGGFGDSLAPTNWVPSQQDDKPRC